MQKKSLMVVGIVVVIALIGFAFFYMSRGEPNSQSATSTTSEELQPSGGTLGPEQIEALVAERVDAGIDVLAVAYNNDFLVADEPLSADQPFLYQVTDSRFGSIEQMLAWAQTIYIPELVDQIFGDLSGPVGEYTHFQDIDGQLYVNLEVGGRGISADWDTSSVQVISQTPDEIIFTMDLYRFDEFQETHQLSLQQFNGNWVWATKIDL